MTVESAGIPLPSEIIMPLGGLLSPNLTALAVVVVVGTAGNLAGSWIAYGIGAGIRSRMDPARGAAGTDGAGLARRRPEPLNPPVAGARGGRWHAHWQAAYAWWERRGALAVLIGRVLPGVRTYISFPAGAAAMPPWRFSGYTALGSVVWSGVLAALGYVLRTHWSAIGPWFHRYTAVVLVALVLAAILWFWLGRARRRQA